MSDYILKFNKLDKRHRGHEQFQYYATIQRKTNHPTFTWLGYINLRNLCRETWGDSCEREIYLDLAYAKQEVNPYWAWHTDMNNGLYRIYLKSDAEKAWLLLKW
jgi:hypothetical protein